MSRVRVAARVVAAMIVMGLLTAAAGCSQGPGGRSEASVLVITGQRGLTVNPYSPRLADRRIGRLLFRGLFVTGPEGDPEPDLAVEVPTVANGGISEGGRTVTYRIRDDVRWHDGAPLTARDVAFTIRAIVDGHLVDDPGEDFGAVTSAEVVDDTTVRVRFSRPDSVMAWRLAPYVMPEHLLAASPAPAGDRFWYDPVGTGAYSVESWDPDGTLRLSPEVEGAPRLVLRPLPIEAEAMRAFNEAQRAVWLDAVGEPAGSGESLSTTYGPVWRRLIFCMSSDDSPWADTGMRLAVAGMTTSSMPADVPDSAYPYGIRPPVTTVPGTRTARAVFESRGWRYVPLNKALLRDGRRLDLVVGMNAVRPEEEKRTLGIMRVWDSTGMHSAIVAASFPIKTTWSEHGDLARGVKDGFMYPFADGRPWGWAFPFVMGDEPSFDNQSGLNFARVSDLRLQQAYEAVRTAPDPATARTRMATVGRRVYELGLEIDLYPVVERVLYKGVSGVRAWPSQDEALAQAVEWRAVGAVPAEATPAGR